MIYYICGATKELEAGQYESRAQVDRREQGSGMVNSNGKRYIAGYLYKQMLFWV